MNYTQSAAALAVAAALGTPALSMAAEYFVSETGQDAQLGRTRAAPWRDLQKAVNRLRPGDTLNIVGRYQAPRSVTVSVRGTPAAPITIRGLSADGKAAVPVTCTSGDDKDYCIGFWEASYVRLSSLEFDGNAVPDRVKTMIYIGHSDNIIVDANVFRNVKKYGAYLDGDLSRDHHHIFNGNLFENSTETALYLNRSVDLTVTNNTIRNFSEGDGIVVADSRNATIAGNKVSGLIGLGPLGNGRDGIKVRPSENVVVRGNEVRDVQGVGIYLVGPEGEVTYKRSHKVQVVGNLVTRADRKNEGTHDPLCNQGGWPSALNVTRTDDVDVLSNQVYENYGEGITLSDTTQARVKYNNAHDNFGVNYYLNNAAHVVVDSNLAVNDPEKQEFFRCLAPAGGIGMANETADHNNFVALTDITITNNILAKSRFGINFFWEPSSAYHPVSGLNSVTIRNNTVYHAYTHSLFISRSRHGNNRIESNIFAQVSNNAPDVIESGPRGFTCTANLWWSIQNPGICASASDVRGDPQFVNAASGAAANDYRITASSPAIDAARYSTPTQEIFWDYFGTKRALNATDIGAHEYR